MLGTLIESKRQRGRSPGTVVASVLVHAAGVLLMANVVRGVEQPKFSERAPADTLWFTPTQDPKKERATTTRTNTGTHTGTVTTSEAPRQPVFTGKIPDVIPPPGTVIVDDLSSIPDLSSGEFGVGTTNPDGAPGGSGASDGSTTPALELAIPDEPVRQVGGATPRYPERLRTSGLEGRVLVRFIVDSTGRFEPGSLNIVASDHDLFSRAVTEALSRMRFRAARASGRGVRAMAEQEFVFELRR